MKMQRCLTKRRLLVLAAVAVFYVGFWLLTHVIGARQIRNVALEAMHVPTQGMIEPSGHRSPVTYHCFTKAYAPFLVRADYGWGGGSLYGNGGSAFIFVVFWPRFPRSGARQLVELNHQHLTWFQQTPIGRYA